MTYCPGNIFNRPNRTVYSHSFRRTILFGPNPNKGYLSRSDIFFDNFMSIFTEKSKNDEASSMDFEIESPNYGDQR